MIDVICAHGPMSVGESRVLQVAGDGPFTVKVGFFVTEPAPLGLQEHATQTVEAYEDFKVTADTDFWSQRKGGIQIDLVDAKGAKRRVHFNIQPAARSLTSGIVRA